MNNLFYSIIVPSFNRKDEISALLNSFSLLDFPSNRYELIIVDDGSSDGTENLVKTFQQQNPIETIYLSQQNQGPGAARNYGMEYAHGDFFIFVDSDCTVDENWLKMIDRELLRTGADAFGGPDNCRIDFPPLLKAINYSMTSFITTGGIRGHRKKKLGKFYPRSFNMGLQKELYNKIGGFGSLRHGQDIEFSNRILKSGSKVIQIDEAVVYHKRRTSLLKFLRQVFNWGVARINLYLIDKSMLETVHFIPAIALWLAIIITVPALFCTACKIVFVFCAITGAILLLFSAIDCYRKYKSIKTALLTVVIIPVQIFGYGLGFTTALIRRVIFKRGEFTGFTKRYYQ